MKIIKVSHRRSSFPPLSRQTPGGNGIWGECKFLINQEVDECDAWIIIDGIDGEERTKCPRGNVILITQEPPAVRTYNPLFLRQFDLVISPHTLIMHRNVVHSQPALPWFIGARFDRASREWSPLYSKSYDELKSMSQPKKTKLASVITSDKVITREHQRRLRFVKTLEKRMGGQLDVLITGKDSILGDKWDALADYRYHIALENSVCPDYWTEKLADPFLALCHPVYYGCPNLSKYFPSESFTAIDIRKEDRAIETIARVLESDTYERSLPYLMQAKISALDEYNFFPFMARVVSSRPTSRKDQIRLTPELVIPRGRRILKFAYRRMKNSL